MFDRKKHYSDICVLSMVTVSHWWNTFIVDYLDFADLKVCEHKVDMTGIVSLFLFCQSPFV